jgi:hypothetical protein
VYKEEKQMNMQGFFEAAMEFSFMGRDFTIENAAIQAVIVFAVLLQVLGWQFKHKIHILTCHVIATFLYATHWRLITDFTAHDATASFYINVIGVIRLLFFISVVLYVKRKINASLEAEGRQNGRKSKKARYLTFVEKYFFWVLMVAYIVAMFVRVFISMNNGTDTMVSDIAGAVFAAMASILYTTLFWKFPEKVMRMGQIFVSILLMLQAWFLGSWVGIGEIAVLGMTLLSIYRYDLDYDWKRFWPNCKATHEAILPKRRRSAKEKARKQFENFTQA